MARASILETEDYQYLMERLDDVSQCVARDRAIVVASFKQGLRVAEIAGLTWRAVTTSRGSLDQSWLKLPNNIAKKGSGRDIPMHPDFVAALHAYRQTLPITETTGNMPVFRPLDRRFPHNAASPIYAGGAFEPNTLQRYLSRLFGRCGLVGVTSHSGRRTALTALARIANTHKCSLRDVQVFAGHKYLDTTQGYIERSKNFHEMVEAL